MKQKLIIKKVAFVIPIYPPHFGNAKQLYNTYIHNNLNEQADFWLIFTDENEKEACGEYKYSIVYNSKLGVDRDGIINKKKLYALNELKDKYEYIIILDSESLFIKNINIFNICKQYFSKKILYGNKINNEAMDYVNLVRDNCKRFFIKNNNFYKLNTDLYLWFNQPCIYKASHIKHFFNIIDYDKNISNIKFIDYDYYIYMYYLILYYDFQIEDMEITATLSACQNVLNSIFFNSDKYKRLNILLCSKFMIDYFDNKNLFLLIQLDKVFDSQVINVREELNKNILTIQNQCQTLQNNLKGLIDSIAWWIPIRKLRDNFKRKFFDNFIWGGVMIEFLYIK